jgi:hypothetical protein
MRLYFPFIARDKLRGQAVYNLQQKGPGARFVEEAQSWLTIWTIH